MYTIYYITNKLNSQEYHMNHSVILVSMIFSASFLMGSEKKSKNEIALFFVNLLYPKDNPAQFFFKDEQPLTKNAILCMEIYREDLEEKVKMEKSGEQPIIKPSSKSRKKLQNRKRLPFKKRFKK